MNNASIYNQSSLFMLEGQDIRLREFVLEDLDEFCDITAQPHIREFLPDWYVDKETRRVWLYHYEIPDSRAFLERAMRDGQVENRMLRLAVIERSSGRFIGWCCTSIKDELSQPNREIVYGLSADCCGKGYMTQAVHILVDWLFEHTDTQIVHGIAKPDNMASNRVLQKCGFESLGETKLEDGIHRHYVKKK